MLNLIKNRGFDGIKAKIGQLFSRVKGEAEREAENKGGSLSPQEFKALKAAVPASELKIVQVTQASLDLTWLVLR